MRVIGLLKSMHRHVFVDCGHVLEPAIKEALDCSDQIIVITTLSLPAIRRTRQLLEALRSAHYAPGKVAVVVNRYASDQKEFLKETEGMFGMRMAGLIPNDYGTAREAMDHGKPLTIIAAKKPVGQWYMKEVDRLIVDKASVNEAIAEKDPGKKPSFFGRYLPSFGLETRRKPSIV
jgi:pilus assembly protein CpaE